MATVKQARIPAVFRFMHLPRTMFKMAPASGSKGINRSSIESVIKAIGCTLSLEKMHFLGIQSWAVAVPGNHDGEPDNRLGRSHSHDEDDNHLAFHGA